MFVTRSFFDQIVVLQHFDFFLKTMNKEYLLQKTGRVGSRQFMMMSFFRKMKKVPWALCLGDIDSNLICLEALEGDIANLVAWKIQRVLQAGFNKNKIKRGLMLIREIPWSTLAVEQTYGTTASIHKLHPLMEMKLQNVIERLRRTRPRWVSERQAYFRELVLEVKAV